MPLTIRKELFVRALLSDPKPNASAAVIAAGYSEKRVKITPRELMNDPEVQMALHERQIAALNHGYPRLSSNVAAAWAKPLTPVAHARVFEPMGCYLKLWANKVELSDVGSQLRICRSR